ncbi:hypothetical protein PIB30_019132 [Stylosanthes scabra]|uniref:Uncharacterized protein n=1 Tax=Stylosanthes scabra TaxID=79078 RepID=A0ABU6W6F2_9FABA|nr:hypothetical protein [Stylosanthes scabra]
MPLRAQLGLQTLKMPASLCGYEFQGSPDAFSASIHEYKIPPKGLLGLHSYCPVNFDAFHTSVHVSLLKASHHTSRPKVSSDSRDSEGTYVEDYVGSNKDTLIKALMTAHDILLEDLKRISTGIGQAVDLTEITSASDVTPPATVNGDSSPQLSDRAHVLKKNGGSFQNILQASLEKVTISSLFGMLIVRL